MENFDKEPNYQRSSQVELICGISSFFHKPINSSLIFHLKRKIFSNFIVNEIYNDNIVIENNTNLDFLKKTYGLFSYHILSKKGIDTPQAIKKVANRFNIPENWIDYSGLKDAQAETQQLISIWSPTGSSYSSSSFSNLEISSGTISNYGLKLGNLSGNQFKITLDCNDNLHNYESKIDQLVSNINLNGIPNFFGTQRFGTIRPISHLIGKALLQKNWKLAALSYLSLSTNLEQEYIKNLRSELVKTLDYSKFISLMPKNFNYEIRIAKELKKSNNYQKAIFSIPKKILLLFIGSYQSFIFNWILSKYIDSNSKFEFENVEIPLVGFTTNFNNLDSWAREEITKIFHIDNISLDSFNQEDTWINIKGANRKAFVKPGNFNYKINKNQVVLCFTLKKGSYATSLIREIKNDQGEDTIKVNRIKDYNAYQNKLKSFFESSDDNKLSFNLL
jgi:tRNA pseudouridine13 synthase